MKKLLLVALCCLSISTRIFGQASIVGGHDIDITDAPWQISLRNAVFNNQHTCGGSIINPTWVLTAAHCVEGQAPGNLKILAGSTNQTQLSNGQLVQVAEIIIHPDYHNDTLAIENDIALLRLETPLLYGAGVGSIQYATELNLPDNLMNPGTMVNITGWGVTNNIIGYVMSNTLKSADIPLISTVDANQLNSQATQFSSIQIHEGMIAAYSPGQGAHWGDSGGPMVVQNNGVPILIGCSSWGLFPKGQFPTVYAKVKSYSSWIEESMAPNSWSFLQMRLGTGSAGSGAGVFRLKARHSGQALEIGGGPSLNTNFGARANQWPYVGGRNQQWDIFSMENGYVGLGPLHSYMILEVPGGSQNPGAPVTQDGARGPWGSVDYQQWRIESIGSGYYKVLARHSGQALEIGGGPLATNGGATANQWPYVGSSNQQWEVEDINIYNIVPEYISIDTIHTLPCLGVANINGNATFTQQLVVTQGTGVTWQIASTGGGKYKLISQFNDQSLQIPGGSVQNGTSANVGPYAGNPWQQWQVEVVRQGLWGRLYRLIAQHSGRALTVSGTGTNLTVTQEPYTGSANQHFFLMNGGGPTRPTAHRGASTGKVLSTSTQRSINRVLSLFPNPASTQLTLSLADGVPPLSVMVTDSRGAKAHTVYSRENGKLDVTKLPSGLYMITASDGVRQYRHKFVKQ